MNTFVIILSGVMLFMRVGGEVTDPRHLIIPTITELRYRNRHITNHTAYIAVPRGTADHTAWGEPDKRELINGRIHDFFFLRGEQLTINAADSALDATQHQSLVPKITEYCPGFTLNSSFPLAASLFIDRGVLTASGNVRNDEPVVSKLTVQTNGPLVIGVRNSSRKLTIPPGTDVRIENEATTRADSHNHFLTYYAMSQDQTCDASRVPGPPQRSRRRGTGDRNRDRNPGADCSNSQYP